MESKWKWFPLKYERSRSQIFSINTPAYHHFVSKSLWMLRSLTIEHKQKTQLSLSLSLTAIYRFTSYDKCTYCKSLWIKASAKWSFVSCLSSIKLHWSDRFVPCIIHLHYYCIMRALFLCTSIIPLHNVCIFDIWKRYRPIQSKED